MVDELSNQVGPYTARKIYRVSLGLVHMITGPDILPVR